MIIGWHFYSDIWKIIYGSEVDLFVCHHKLALPATFIDILKLHAILDLRLGKVNNTAKCIYTCTVYRNQQIHTLEWVANTVNACMLDWV